QQSQNKQLATLLTPNQPQKQNQFLNVLGRWRELLPVPFIGLPPLSPIYPTIQQSHAIGSILPASRHSALRGGGSFCQKKAPPKANLKSFYAYTQTTYEN